MKDNKEALIDQNRIWLDRRTDIKVKLIKTDDADKKRRRENILKALIINNYV